jgi:hypothetical protein
MTIQDGITRRSADIQWPDGLTPTDADLFAHNEIVIQAPPQQVSQHVIAVWLIARLGEPPAPARAASDYEVFGLGTTRRVTR